MFRDVFKTCVLLSGHPARAFFLTKKRIFQKNGHDHFSKMSVRQKIDLLVTYLERYLTKVVGMHRTDHLGFW